MYMYCANIIEKSRYIFLPVLVIYMCVNTHFFGKICGMLKSGIGLLQVSHLVGKFGDHSLCCIVV